MTEPGGAAERLRWDPSSGHGRERPILVTPARMIVALGSLLVAIGALLPWAEGLAPRGTTRPVPVRLTGFEDAGDGLLLLVLAALLAWVGLSRSAAASRTRTIRLAPAVLGLATAMVWVIALRGAQDVARLWEQQGGSGSVGPGLWIAGAGALLALPPSLWLGWPGIRWRQPPADAADAIEIRPSAVAEAVAGVVGAGLGGAAGIAIGLTLAGPTIVGALVFGAIYGGWLGAVIGSRLVRLAARLRPGGRLEH